VAGCPFCDRISVGSSVAYAEPFAVAFPDGFPVADGHLLVVPRRHLARLEELEAEEWLGVFGLVRQVCRELAGHGGVVGLNIGVNSGAAAGQTVEHAHVHVIPRRHGDVEDPRGGVRGVIAARADYWSHQ
jgi:diadenosine tetraphosphate (Ap4A) HIT family hydrolase